MRPQPGKRDTFSSRTGRVQRFVAVVRVRGALPRRSCTLELERGAELEREAAATCPTPDCRFGLIAATAAGLLLQA